MKNECNKSRIIVFFLFLIFNQSIVCSLKLVKNIANSISEFNNQINELTKDNIIKLNQLNDLFNKIDINNSQLDILKAKHNYLSNEKIMSKSNNILNQELLSIQTLSNNKINQVINKSSSNNDDKMEDNIKVNSFSSFLKQENEVLSKQIKKFNKHIFKNNKYADNKESNSFINYLNNKFSDHSEAVKYTTSKLDKQLTKVINYNSKSVEKIKQQYEKLIESNIKIIELQRDRFEIIKKLNEETLLSNKLVNKLKSLRLLNSNQISSVNVFKNELQSLNTVSDKLEDEKNSIEEKLEELNCDFKEFQLNKEINTKL